MLKQPKVRSEKHRRFIAILPCIVCRVRDRTQAAHIRTGNNAGVGLKSGDDCCVPLCVECHHEQHHFSEKKYWGKNLDLAQEIAKKLYEHTGNEVEALRQLARFK